MSSPYQPSAATGGRKPLIDKPIAIALALLAVLAVVTVVVVITKSGDEDPGTTAGPTTSSEASSATTEPSSSDVTPSPATPGVVDTGLGISYDYPYDENPFTTTYWGGPGDSELDSLSVKGLVAYAACNYEAGSDLVVGAVSTSESDLKKAAEATREALPTNLWDEGGTLTDTATQDQETATLDEGVLAVGTVEHAADECNNTKARIAAFAVKNADDETVVVFASYRTDGDTRVAVDGLKQAAAEILFSIRHT